MTKHATDTASTTKKFLAAAGLAFGMASLGLFANAGTAAADGHDVQNPGTTLGSCPVHVGNCSSSGDAWGATDEDSASRHLSYDQPYGVDMVPADFSYVTASYPAGGSYPAATVNDKHQSPMPAPANLPSPSWPDGWGVDEHG